MAAITATVAEVKRKGRSIGQTFTWAAVTEADTFVAVEFGDLADRTVQLLGTFGSATLLVKGSLDGTNYETLRDALGNNLSFTAAGLKSILETTPHINITHSGGTSESVTVVIFGRRPT